MMKHFSWIGSLHLLVKTLDHKMALIHIVSGDHDVTFSEFNISSKLDYALSNNKW